MFVLIRTFSEQPYPDVAAGECLCTDLWYTKPLL